MKKGYLVSLLLSELKAEKIPSPILEHQFHPIRRWRFDCAWISQKVALEVHGAVYAGGRHTRGQGFERDREKMNEAQLMGWTVLEYSTGQIRDGEHILDLKRALKLNT